MYRMAYGEWTENSRGSYNRWDAVARSTTQVYFFTFYFLKKNLWDIYFFIFLKK